MPYPDQWTDEQDSPEITVNNMAAGVAHVATYARRPKTTAGLVWGIYGGRWGGFVNADQTFTLDDDTTSYQVVEIATGEPSISDDDTNWLDTDNFARCYLITTAGGVVTAYEDHRGGPGGIGGGAGGGGGSGAEPIVFHYDPTYEFVEDDKFKLHIFINGDDDTDPVAVTVPGPDGTAGSPSTAQFSNGWWVDCRSGNIGNVVFTPLDTNINAGADWTLTAGQSGRLFWNQDAFWTC